MPGKATKAMRAIMNRATMPADSIRSSEALGLRTPARRTRPSTAKVRVTIVSIVFSTKMLAMARPMG